jgi:hypothetical protein
LWASVLFTAVCLAAGTATAALAKDRENALESRARQSKAQKGRFIFDQDSADLESQGESFEAAAVMSFILGGVGAGAAGTLLYLDRQEPRSRAGVSAPFVWTMSF